MKLVILSLLTCTLIHVTTQCSEASRSKTPLKPTTVRLGIPGYFGDLSAIVQNSHNRPQSVATLKQQIINNFPKSIKSGLKKAKKVELLNQKNYDLIKLFGGNKFEVIKAKQISIPTDAVLYLSHKDINKSIKL